MSTVLVGSTPITSAADARRDVSDRMRVAVTAPADTVTLCSVAGEVDGFTVGEFRNRLIGALPTANRLVVVDLSMVTFFGVAGLQVLMEAHSWIGHIGCELRLVTGPPCVDRLLDVSGYGSSFDIRENLMAALAPPHFTRALT